MEGAFAAASLRNSAARRRSPRWCGPPGEPGRPGTASSPTPDRAVEATRAPVLAPASMFQPVIRPLLTPGPGAPSSTNSARSASWPIRFRTKRSPARVSSIKLAPCRSVACHHGVVGRRVMAHQRGVDDGDPPHRLTDHRQGSRRSPALTLGSRSVVSLIAVMDPQERARPGGRIARMLAVPCDPAANRAEPGVLAARHERGAALLAVPDISHRTMLRVTCAAVPDTAAWKPP